MEQYNKKSESPFTNPLVKSELSYSLLELQNRPDKVIRMQSVKEFTTKFKVPNSVEAVRQCDKLFDELHTKYDIKVAPTERVIGKSESGNNVVYAISDKIDGVNLTSKKFELLESDYARKKLDQFITSLLEYIRSKYASNERYLSDIYANEQYVYGKEKGGQVDEIYLVALDPKINEYKPDSHSTDLSRCLNGVFAMLFVLEEKLGGLRLERARSKFLALLDDISVDDPNQAQVAPLKDWLS